MSAHPTKLTVTINLEPVTVAKAISGLRYDKLKEFLTVLQDELHGDAVKDGEAGRPKLSSELSEASRLIRQACHSIDKAWKICEKHETN